MFVTIDPGLATGWAIWSDDGLVACGLGDPRLSPAHVTLNTADPIRDVWIEKPVIYPRSPVPPNDIAKLAWSAGEWAGRYDARGLAVHSVEPATWKGQVPKDIHHARVWAALTPAEQRIVEVACSGLAPSKRHNVLDAVGLGQWVRKHAVWR